MPIRAAKLSILPKGADRMEAKNILIIAGSAGHSWMGNAKTAYGMKTRDISALSMKTRQILNAGASSKDLMDWRQDSRAVAKTQPFYTRADKAKNR